MLSYRHAFHAGNFADILKHIVLVDILEHLQQKDKPFDYIDTHAGAGLYDFRSSRAQKLGEHVDGILRLRREEFPELAHYFDVISAYNSAASLTVYPGSPSFASHFLRPNDRGWLYELHPQDYQSLRNTMQKSKNIRVQCADGLKALLALLPPGSRRGLVLIDPSYEVKTEFDQVIDTLIKGYKKFATGIYAIWYPVVDRRKINYLEQQLVRSGIRNIQRFELGVAADSASGGMTSSGMIVINPPWKLFDKMSSVLPRIAEVIGPRGAPETQTQSLKQEHFYRCDVLVSE